MTNERAKSELEQLYMSLSEEKKKALDVAFKAMEQAIPVMYYPQVDGITPTVVAQADGEKNCFNCKWYPDNGITKGFDEVCHKCSNSDKWEGLIKRAPWEDIASPPKIPEAQADGEYIPKQAVLENIDKWYEDKADIEDLIVKITYMLSLAIPSAEPQWVPVSERLPEEKKAVLVWCPQYKNIYCAYLEKEQWWIFGAFVQIVPNEVVAWMPLPKSYEPQESEDKE